MTSFYTDSDICEATNVGLVRYPATLAPVSGTVPITVQCTENAQITSSVTSVTCNENGVWGIQTPVCECIDGYESATVGEVEICQR